MNLYKSVRKQNSTSNPFQLCVHQSQVLVETIEYRWNNFSHYFALEGVTIFSPSHCFSWTVFKGLFALREILFVLQKNRSTRNHFQCERFFSSTKILSSVTKLQRHRRVALEAYNFLSSEKIYCSVTATLQRVIIFRNRYHTKWYCVRDPIYCHLPPFRNG